MRFSIFPPKADPPLADNSQFSKRKHGGFTLLELLVALSVFGVVATAALSIYSVSLKAYQRSLQVSHIQGEIVLMMEVMTKRIRSSAVDYAWYGGTVDCPQYCQPVLTLALTDQDGMKYLFRAEGGNLNIDAGGTGTYQVFNSQRVTVTDLRFFIFPTTSPFFASAAPIAQPRVVMNLTVTPQGRSEPALVIEQSIPQRSGI